MTQENTTTELERSRRDLADLETMKNVVEMKVRLNLPNSQIAKNLGIHPGSVDKYIKRARQHYIEKIEADLGEQRAVMVAELEIVKREAWNSWNQSKDVAESVERLVELGDWGDDERETVSAVVTKLRRTPGNPRYLKVIQDVIKQESDLLGLEIKRSPTTNDRGERITSEERRERIIEIIDRAKERQLAVEGDDDDSRIESG